MDYDLLDSLSDEALVQEIQCGKLDAFGILYRRYHNEVHYRVLMIVDKPEDAQDIAQDTFWKVYQQLPTLRLECKFRSWLLTIAKNYSIDHWRRLGRDKSFLQSLDSEFVEGEDKASSPEESVIGDEQLKDALQQLKPQLREIVSLHMQGYTFEEIASGLRLSVGSVRTYLSDARRKLRQTFPSRRRVLKKDPISHGLKHNE
jgi:RNA polymerase sigma-70 factor (ECF subfamily)